MFLVSYRNSIINYAKLIYLYFNILLDSKEVELAIFIKVSVKAIVIVITMAMVITIMSMDL